MLKLYSYFLQFVLNIQSCEKRVQDKRLWGITKLNELCISFLAILRHFQYFLRKLHKLVNIRNARIVYLINFGMQFSTFLKYLFWQMN